MPPREQKPARMWKRLGRLFAFFTMTGLQKRKEMLIFAACSKRNLYNYDSFSRSFE